MKAVWLVLLALPAQEERRAPAPEVDANTRAAIRKGLDYLARQQTRSGAMPGSVSVASTSVVCLAWMAEGSTPHEGRYAENLKRGLRFILRSCHRTGFITDGGQSGMYGHGFSTLFLAEVYGTLRDPDEIEQTRETLRRAVDCLQRTQNRYGGWNATPDANATDDGSGAVAIMQITALRAARNAGIQVESETIKKAKKYVLEMTGADGWYAYNYHARGGGHRSSAVTGAGMYMLGVLDCYADDRYEKGIRNLLDSAPFLGRSGNDQGWSGWFHYTAFFASLAVFQRGGEPWKKWYPALRDDLLKKQLADGQWSGDPYNGLYSAFALLALELPLRYLPIFQDGGRGAEGN